MNRKLRNILISVAIAVPMAVLAAYTDEIILHIDTGNLIQNGDGYQVVSNEGDYIPISYPPQILYDDDVNLRDGLVAYWDMDEISGVRYDSHWDNSLTDNNTVGYTTTSIIGMSAASVGANNEYLSIQDVISGPVLLSGWYLAGSANNALFIKLFYDDGISLYVNGSTTSLSLYFYDSVSDCEIDTSVTGENLSEWRYIVLYHDRDSQSTKLWLDGELEIDEDWSECEVSTGAQYDIELLTGFSGAYVYGDELCLYNRELTESEINILYNGGAGLSYDDFAPSYDLDDLSDLISGNTTWSARLLWTPQYSATVDWPVSGAVLFDSRGSSDSERVRLLFDDSDDAYHVYINGADRLASPAQSFTNGEEQDVIMSLSFNADEYALYVNGTLTDTDTTILGAPELNDWWVGRLYSGTTTASAEYSEVTLFDEYLDPVDVAAIYGESMNRQEIGGAEDLTNGLISYWQMEETSGTRADSWGDNDLTDNNTVLYATGMISNAAQMSAANAEYLGHSSNASLNTGNIDFTVFGFAYMDTLTNTGIIERNGEYALHYDTTVGLWAFSVSNAACDDVTTVYATSSVVTDTWYGVVGWHDVSNGYLGIRVNHDETIIPYLDGVCNSGSTGNVFWVGRSFAGYHDGRIDEVAFWKRALTPIERMYIVKGYFNDMRPSGAANNPRLHMPLIVNAYVPSAITPTPTPFPYASPTPDSPFIGIDYGGDTSWTEWAKKIEEFFAPVFLNIDAVEGGVDELRADVCGIGFNEGVTFLPGDQYNYATEADLGENPTVLEVAYTFGMALGRPFAWIRSLYNWLPVVNSEYNVGGVNFFVMLVYFMTAGIVWMSFVIIVTYSAHFVRTMVDFIIKIYELIPFKST